MSFQCYCKIDGIPGECTDDQHKDYAEVLSFSHGMNQESSGSVSGSGSHFSGQVNHDGFSIVKRVDKASPKLALTCSKGDHIKEVLIECWRQIGENSKFMEYKLTDAAIRSLHPSGGGDDLPAETVTFVYSRIDWTYTEYDNKGKKKGDIKGYWDLEKHKGG